MPRNHRTDADSSLTDRLFEAFEEASAENEAVMREELTELGMDPDRLVEEDLKLVKQLLGQQKLAIAEREYQRVLDAIQAVKGRTTENLGVIRERIAKSLAGEENEQLVMVFHRKLEAFEPEDLISLEDDKQKLFELISILKDENR